MAKKVEIIEDREICQGIKLSKGFYEYKENRLLTLLVKGFIVYLLTMGSIGFYLSALDIDYNKVLCNVVIFLMAMACAMLYYRLLTENLGYLVLLFAFCGLVYLFKTYINSGFYAIVNITVDSAAQYFNIDIQRVYSEQITNRYVTVTFAVLFIGIVLDIFLNVYISRRMQYVTAVFVVMGLNMIPLYLIFEPDGLYTVMTIAGIALAYVFRSGKHYSPQVSVKRDDLKYKDKGKKKEIAYVYDVKAMINAGIVAFCFVVLLVSLVSAFKPKETFNVGYKGNKYKNLTMTAVSTILMDGWSGFFRLSRDVGGLHGGELGDVSTIRLDYQTDLVVQLTPYTYDRIYLKGFTGVRYNPYANCWTGNNEVDGAMAEAWPEAESLREDYLQGKEYSAQATLKIYNIQGYTVYRPYYFYNMTENKQYLDMLFYPRMEDNETYIDRRYYKGTPYTDADLFVPEENLEAVSQIVPKLGNPITDEDIINSLIDYYQENIPYTIQPGRTPRDADFVNDFLLDKKKGYCAHYASAAVLIFRYMGIPARYVEGYAVDFEQMYNGEIVSIDAYGDYYDGYSEIGETALLSVDVTDADAHAWVEVYDDQYGWHPVEVTPIATNQEDVEDFWSMLADMMDESGAQGNDAVENAFGANNTVNKVIKSIAYGIATFIALIVAVFLIIKLVGSARYLIRFVRADINDRLIYRYQRICTRYRRRDKVFREKVNYREQIEYLMMNKNNPTEGEIEKSQEKVIAILEKAGFSQDVLSSEEYDFVVRWCKEYI